MKPYHKSLALSADHFLVAFYVRESYIFLTVFELACLKHMPNFQSPAQNIKFRVSEMFYLFPSSFYVSFLLPTEPPSRYPDSLLLQRNILKSDVNH